MDEKALIAGGL